MDLVRHSSPDYWLEQVLSAKSASSGSVARRSRTWCAAEIGLERFDVAVHARRFHMIEAGQHLIVICHSGPVRLSF